MIQKNNNEENIEFIYAYDNKLKQKFWTPNALFAQTRAAFFGTEAVYVEKIKVINQEDKKINF